MSEFSTAAPYRVRQAPARARYDHETAHAILDEGLVAHIAFASEAGPVAIPMFYVRDGQRVLIHASRKSRLMRSLIEGAPLCLTVTLIDGLVMARSAFHHSMNFRSVTVHGRATPLAGEEKLAAMSLFVERVQAGRSAEVRAPNARELKATEVLAIPLVDVAAKVRSGGPLDDEEDLSLPVWAGVVPIASVYGTPVDA